MTQSHVRDIKISIPNSRHTRCLLFGSLLMCLLLVKLMLCNDNAYLILWWVIQNVLAEFCFNRAMGTSKIRAMGTFVRIIQWASLSEGLRRLKFNKRQASEVYVVLPWPTAHLALNNHPHRPLFFLSINYLI